MPKHTQNHRLVLRKKNTQKHTKTLN